MSEMRKIIETIAEAASCLEVVSCGSRAGAVADGAWNKGKCLR